MTTTSTNRPLVVHVIDELPRDGAEMLLLDLMRRRDARLRYVVLCLVRGGPLQSEFENIGVPVVVLGQRSRLDPILLWTLLSWLRRERPSVVHTHLFLADSYGRLAAALAGVPAIFSTVHNIVGPGRGVLRTVLHQGLARWSTAVIGCGDEIAQSLIRQGLPQARVQSIPNGIDLLRFGGVEGAGVREEFGIPAERSLIGVVGRLHRQKGHDVLFQALADMSPAERAGLACLVVGTGELEAELRRLSSSLGLDDCVIFTGMRTDVPRLVAALDLFVMPSRWEGLPIALLEAMASRTAVLCTRVGSIPGVVRDGENGALIAPEDPRGLRESILRLLAQPALREEYGRRARDEAVDRFDITRTASAYNQLHARALGLAATAHGF
jgi:glycosyltransferase involved in cell wall biosynthesis